MRRTASLLFAGALGLAAWTAADAQAVTPPEAPKPGEWRAHAQEMREQRARDLRTVLRLRPDQESALQAWLAAMSPQRREPPAGRRGAPEAALSTPERLDEMARREAEHAGEAQRRLEAERTFYAALSPEQQAVFDALERLQRRGPGGPRGFGGPRRIGPGGPGHGGPPPQG